MGNQSKKAHRLSTVQRIFISYICICLVPIVLLTGALTLSSYQTQKREETARQTHIAESAARTLDGEFRRIKNLGQQLRDMSWVKKRGAVSGLFDHEFDLNRKIEICSDLRGYTTASGILHRIAVVFPEKDEVYSSSGLYNTMDFFHSFSLERNQQALEPQTVYDNLPSYIQGSLVTGAEIGMTASSANKIFYLEELGHGSSMRSFLMAEIDPYAIGYMVSMTASPDLLQFYVTADSLPLVSLSFNQESPEVYYEFQSNYFPVKLVSGFSSPVPIGRQDLLPVLILVLICISFSVNFALILTRLTYRPIKELLKHIRGKRTESEKRIDDFELIEQTFSQLYTENENVLRMAENYRDNAKESCLRRLLQADYSVTQASEKLLEFEIPFSDDMTYLVLVVGESQLDLPLEEALSIFDLQYEIVTLSKKRTAVILAMCSSEEHKLDLPALTQRVTFICQEHSGTAPVVICGKPEAGILGIGKSFSSAVEQLASKPSDPIRSAVSERRYYFPTEWAMQLINHVKYGQADLAQTILTRLLEENQKKNLDMQRLLTVLAQTYGRIITELAADPKHYETQFDAIASETTVDGMWKQLICLNQMICSEKSASNQDANIELQLVAYVKEHLTDPDLSLKELSSRFNLSVSAISKLFKRTCGINFYDFLLSGRMDTACEIIKTQKLSLPAVARAVGYENEYSFKRAFSRFYGMSVSEYLRKNSAGINNDK